MGRAASLALGSKVDRIAGNMARGLGERPELPGWARETFATHFGNQYIGFLFGKCTADTWDQYLELRGLSHLQDAHAHL